MILDIWFFVFVLVGILAGVFTSLYCFTPEDKNLLLMCKVFSLLFLVMSLIGLVAVFSVMWSV